jgi:hypothetical protein
MTIQVAGFYLLPAASRMPAARSAALVRFGGIAGWPPVGRDAFWPGSFGIAGRA